MEEYTVRGEDCQCPCVMVLVDFPEYCEYYRLKHSQVKLREYCHAETWKRT